MHLLLALLVLLLLCSAASAAVVRGKVEFGELPPTSVSVRLDTNEYALVRQDGTFVFRHVSAGVHELTVVDPLRQFTKILVVVGDDVSRIVELSPGTAQPGVPGSGVNKRQLSSVVLRPIGLLDYFEKRQQMTLSSIFANPMMMMMMFTLVMGMAMPKMMESIDPEELRQAQEQIQGGGGAKKKQQQQVKN